MAYNQMSQSQKNKRHSYKKITEQVRSAIISRIAEGGQPVRTVADSMGVNISTCKAIVKVFQEEGRIGKKKKRNKVVNVVEAFSFYAINDGQVEQLDGVKLKESKLSFKRGENVDKILQDNAREQAEKMFQGIIQQRQRNEQIQHQLAQIQSLQTTYGYYTIPPYMFPPVTFPKKQ